MIAIDSLVSLKQVMLLLFTTFKPSSSTLGVLIQTKIQATQTLFTIPHSSPICKFQRLHQTLMQDTSN